MDVTSLRAVLSELRMQLLPSRFVKAQQGSAQGIQLGLRSLSGVHWLELSWQAEAPRLHGIAPPPRQGEGSTLAQQLQHTLRGLALVEIAQTGWERVVELAFARRPGDPTERWLVLELMGRHSNLLLLDASRSVITLARQVRPQQSRLRPIGTGDPYQPPPPLQGEPPGSAEPMALWQRRLSLAPHLTLRQALQGSYQGVSPALVLQLSDAAMAGTPVEQLTPEQWQHLHQRWLQWLQALEQCRFAFVRCGAGYCCWQSDAAEPDGSPGASLNAAVAGYYATALANRRHHALQQQWQQRLNQLHQREMLQLSDQQTLLAAGEQAESLQRQADALLCEAHLDPAAVTAAQSLYQRARRLRRSGAVIRERIALHEQRLRWLEASLTYLEQADCLEALEPLLSELTADLERTRGGQPRRQGRRGAAGGEPAEPQPLQLCSPGGLRLLVGRNHRQNAWISLRQARRGDLWFHAQECPGSHVVLKASEAPHDAADCAAAAALAAYFSRGRGNGRVPVVMAPTEALQRIPGAPAGTVRHSGGTVLWGEPAAALALLASPPNVEAEPGS